MIQPIAGFRTSGLKRVESRPLASGADCERLVDDTENARAWPAAVASDGNDQGFGRIDPDIRSGRQSPFDLSSPLGVDLVRRVEAINAEMFHFDVCGILAHDPPTINHYSAHSNDHFIRHADVGDFAPFRKLTFSLQLSRSDDYMGGDLYFPELGLNAPRDQGTVTVFSSLLTHVVTPLIRGARMSVVGWIHGHQFR